MPLIIDYGLDQVKVSEEPNSGASPELKGSDVIRWISMPQPMDPSLLRAWVADWVFHPHVAEDLLDSDARANFEEYPNEIYLDMHAVKLDRTDRCEFSQVGLVLHQHGVVSLQIDGVFEEVSGRIQSNLGLIRTKGPDYLFIRLIHSLLRLYDQYFERLDEVLSELEIELVHRPSQRMVIRILSIKRQLNQVRRRLTPLREAIGSLESSAHPLFKRENRPYLRDVRGKVQALHERMDSHRSLLDSLENLYLSSVGQRTNEVVRTLTVFSAIFLPLTFIVGLYGMNFKVMPELEWAWGYPMALVLMALVAASMVLWMRQKKFW
jgi:magnesium transporter